MKNIIYTAIIGSYDELKEPLIITKDVDYFCFTDDENLVSDNWKVVVIKNKRNLTQAQLARDVKINIHRYMLEFNKALWIDANQQINANLMFLFESNIEYDFTLLMHPDRNCIYDEALKCIQLEKDSQDVINNQMKKYFDDSYPRDNSLAATGLMIRNNKEETNKFCEFWFNEILHGSHRDQLSFNYSLVSFNPKISFKFLEFKVLLDNFIRCKHKK